jgi:hypothetical protein
MNEIIEHTPQRLVVRLGADFPHGATCTFDKTTGRARFERNLFFIPRRTIEVALGAVADFEVVEVGPPINSFDLRVTLASGKRFYVSPAATREETQTIARAVRAFLGLG